jgi:hypothetical protein
MTTIQCLQQFVKVSAGAPRLEHAPSLFSQVELGVHKLKSVPAFAWSCAFTSTSRSKDNKSTSRCKGPRITILVGIVCSISARWNFVKMFASAKPEVLRASLAKIGSLKLEPQGTT